MGGQEKHDKSRTGETKKKLIDRRDALTEQLNRWAALNRRLSHPCDRSEVGHQVVELRNRRDALTLEITAIDGLYRRYL